MKLKVLIPILLVHFSVFSQSLKRIEPPFWWVGMQHSELEIMLYGQDLSSLSPKIIYDGISLEKVTTVLNPNYMFISISIAPNTVPGFVPIQLFKNNNLLATINYEIKARERNAADYVGFLCPSVCNRYKTD